MRVVADHIRSTTFLIGDGVMPSNEWRGYVLRKIMRRAMRHGKHLGLTEPFLHKLVAVLDREMGDAYPGIRTGREMIEKTILAEEHRFEAVLTEGLPRLEAELAKVSGTKSKVLLRRRGVQAVRHVRRAVRLHRGHRGDAGRHGRQERLRSARWKASATRRGRRAGSAATKKARRFLAIHGEDAHDAGDDFEGYATTTVTRRADCGDVERRASSRSQELQRGPVRLHRARARRRSISKPAARCRIPVRSRTRPARSRSSTGSRERAPGRRARIAYGCRLERSRHATSSPQT